MKMSASDESIQDPQGRTKCDTHESAQLIERSQSSSNTGRHWQIRGSR